LEKAKESRIEKGLNEVDVPPKLKVNMRQDARGKEENHTFDRSSVEGVNPKRPMVGDPVNTLKVADKGQFAVGDLQTNEKEKKHIAPLRLPSKKGKRKNIGTLNSSTGSKEKQTCNSVHRMPEGTERL